MQALSWSFLAFALIASNHPMKELGGKHKHKKLHDSCTVWEISYGNLAFEG